MKTYISSIIFLLLFCGCDQKRKIPYGVNNLYVDYEYVYGNPKKINENTHFGIETSNGIKLENRVGANIYIFNEDNFVTEVLSYGPTDFDGKTIRRSKNGRLSNYVNYFEEGEKGSSCKFTYDENEMLVEVNIFNKLDELYRKTKIKENSKCLIPIKSNEVFPTGGYNLREIDEDICRTIKKSYFDKNNNLTQKWEYEYNEDALLIKETYTNKEGSSTTTFKYDKFDNEGNWNRKILYREGKLAYVVDREIEYL